MRDSGQPKGIGGEIRTGLIGAGYIAGWHAQALRAVPGVEIAAVCDRSAGAAEALAKPLGVPTFTSLDDLISARICDAVHILTPPNTHRELAIQCLSAGLHTLVEKPFALSQPDARAMNAAAKDAGRVLAVGHNFLTLPGYRRLKTLVRNGELGQISAAEFNWRFPLAPLRSGPFSLWMLRETGNLLRELGPHLFAFAVDLFGRPESFHLSLSKPIDLPGLGARPQSWRILAQAGPIDLSFNISLVETMDDRSIAVFGSGGNARFDYAADILTVARENAADIVLNPLLRQTSMSWQALREGLANGATQAASLNRKSPYGLSFQNTARAFYDAIRSPTASIEPGLSGATGETVTGAIDRVLELLPKPAEPEPARPPVQNDGPTVLVIGGTGFIGRYLTRALAASGRNVRVLSRDRTNLCPDLAGQVETVSSSLKDPAQLRAAIEGCEAVYHLAKSAGPSWEDYLENDVLLTERIARATLKQGVKRFVYTGSIASYDMSRPDVTITETTGFAEDMSDRNFYARAKALAEERLLALHKEEGLPLVIARPGIVVGRGGPLQHWGIGRWNGPGAVRIWNHGRNPLPFVLVEDVANALVAMLESEQAVGQSFNLVGDANLSARGYFGAIHEALGAKITVRSGHPVQFFIAGTVKYLLKRHVLRQHDAMNQSLRDWRSRAHLSAFDNKRAKTVLGWEPEADRAKFVRKAVVEAGLFGF